MHPSAEQGFPLLLAHAVVVTGGVRVTRAAAALSFGTTSSETSILERERGKGGGGGRRAALHRPVSVAWRTCPSCHSLALTGRPFLSLTQCHATRPVRTTSCLRSQAWCWRARENAVVRGRGEAERPAWTAAASEQGAPLTSTATLLSTPSNAPPTLLACGRQMCSAAVAHLPIAASRAMVNH